MGRRGPTHCQIGPCQGLLAEGVVEGPPKGVELVGQFALQPRKGFQAMHQSGEVGGSNAAPLVVSMIRPEKLCPVASSGAGQFQGRGSRV